MREIIRMVHGSHLYGTNVETSDLDYKAVYIPDGQDILLQRVKASIHNGSSQERNQPGQEDVESMSLQQFLKLLCQGQTIALDMIFTPENFWVTAPEPEWRAVLSNQDKFLNRQIKAFVGYCRGQARKYAVKIERFRAVEDAYRFFENAYRIRGEDPESRIADMAGLEEFLAGNYGSSLENITLCNGTVVPHVSVCDTRIPVTASLKEAYAVYARKFNEYGKRVARSAENTAQDWKSMMHAIRVASEAVEFLKTGKLTFPRPEAEFLLDIRRGKVPFDQVSEMIEQGLSRVEDALEVSTLPEEPDWQFADHLVASFYRAAVLENSRDKW